MSNIIADPAPTKINILICLEGCRIENMLIEKNNTSIANCSLYATNLASFWKILGHIHAKMLWHSSPVFWMFSPETVNDSTRMNYKLKKVGYAVAENVLFKEICSKILVEKNHILHSLVLGRGRSESKMP